MYELYKEETMKLLKKLLSKKLLAVLWTVVLILPLAVYSSGVKTSAATVANASLLNVHAGPNAYIR